MRSSLREVRDLSKCLWIRTSLSARAEIPGSGQSLAPILLPYLSFTDVPAHLMMSLNLRARASSLTPALSPTPVWFIYNNPLNQRKPSRTALGLLAGRCSNAILTRGKYRNFTCQPLEYSGVRDGRKEWMVVHSQSSKGHGSPTYLDNGFSLCQHYPSGEGWCPGASQATRKVRVGDR